MSELDGNERVVVVASTVREVFGGHSLICREVVQVQGFLVCRISAKTINPNVVSVTQVVSGCDLILQLSCHLFIFVILKLGASGILTLNRLRLPVEDLVQFKKDTWLGKFVMFSWIIAFIRIWVICPHSVAVRKLLAIAQDRRVEDAVRSITFLCLAIAVHVEDSRTEDDTRD
jgi:hypothetical protein